GAGQGGAGRVGRDGPAAAGRAVEHLDRLRRAAHPEALPPGPRRAQPRRGDHTDPRRPGLPPRRPPAGRAAPRQRRPRRRAPVPPGLDRRLGPGPHVAAGHAREPARARGRGRRLPARGPRARRGHRAPARGHGRRLRHDRGRPRGLARRLPGPARPGGERVSPRSLIDTAAVEATLRELLAVEDPGPAFRIHGDLHLGQFLLADAGWFVLDFEGEPARPPSERTVVSSPLRDVAGMVRSFHYAARTALAERGRDMDIELVDLASAWEARAVEAFLDGYHSVEGVEGLLPASHRDR